MIVKKRKIQGMKTCVQPTVHPVPAAVRGEDTSRAGIDVVARLVGIVHQHEDYRERTLPVLVRRALTQLKEAA